MHIKKYITKYKILIAIQVLFCFVFLYLSHNQAYSRQKQALFVGNAKRHFDSIAQQVDKITFSHGKQAAILIGEMYKIASQSPDSNIIIPHCIYREAVINFIHGKNDSTLIPRFYQASDLLDQKKFPFEKALLDYGLALALSTLGDYANAFTVSLEALEEFKTLNDSLFIAQSLNLLGNICRSIKSYNLADAYYKQALIYISPPKPQYYNILINRYSTSRLIDNKVKESIDSLASLIPILKKKGDIGLLATLYGNLGVSYMIDSDYEKALECFNEVLGFINILDNDRVRIVLYQSLGIYYFHIGVPEKSFQYFLSAKDIAEKANDSEKLSIIFSNLSLLYDYMGKTDSAYIYLKKHNVLSDKMINAARAIEAYRAYVDIYLEASKKELKIRDQELLLKNRRLIALACAAGGIILFIILLLVMMRQQKHKKEIENKELEIRLIQDRQIQQLQQEKLELQTRELTSYSLQLLNKNNTLQEISTLMKQPKISGKSIRGINQIIKNTSSTDQDWQNFKLHFDEVHPDFFSRLKTRCSKLSETELRLCAYIRISLSTKKIAQILNTTPQSMRQSRFRLRKKLNLREEEKLDDFIRTM